MKGKTNVRSAGINLVKKKGTVRHGQTPATPRYDALSRAMLLTPGGNLAKQLTLSLRRHIGYAESGPLPPTRRKGVSLGSIKEGAAAKQRKVALRRASSEARRRALTSIQSFFRSQNLNFADALRSIYGEELAARTSFQTSGLTQEELKYTDLTADCLYSYFTDTDGSGFKVPPNGVTQKEVHSALTLLFPDDPRSGVAEEAEGHPASDDITKKRYPIGRLYGCIAYAPSGISARNAVAYLINQKMADMIIAHPRISVRDMIHTIARRMIQKHGESFVANLLSFCDGAVPALLLSRRQHSAKTFPTFNPVLGSNIKYRHPSLTKLTETGTKTGEVGYTVPVSQQLGVASFSIVERKVQTNIKLRSVKAIAAFYNMSLLHPYHALKTEWDAQHPTYKIRADEWILLAPKHLYGSVKTVDDFIRRSSDKTCFVLGDDLSRYDDTVGADLSDHLISWLIQTRRMPASLKESLETVFDSNLLTVASRGKSRPGNVGHFGESDLVIVPNHAGIKSGSLLTSLAGSIINKIRVTICLYRTYGIDNVTGVSVPRVDGGVIRGWNVRDVSDVSRVKQVFMLNRSDDAILFGDEDVIRSTFAESERMHFVNKPDELFMWLRYSYDLTGVCYGIDVGSRVVKFFFPERVKSEPCFYLAPLVAAFSHWHMLFSTGHMNQFLFDEGHESAGFKELLSLRCGLHQLRCTAFAVRQYLNTCSSDCEGSLVADLVQDLATALLKLCHLCLSPDFLVTGNAVQEVAMMKSFVARYTAVHALFIGMSQRLADMIAATSSLGDRLVGYNHLLQQYRDSEDPEAEYSGMYTYDVKGDITYSRESASALSEDRATGEARMQVQADASGVNLADVEVKLKVPLALREIVTMMLTLNLNDYDEAVDVIGLALHNYQLTYDSDDRIV